MARKKEKYHITVSRGMRGYFAVMLAEDEDGFIEPVQTSPITCRTYAEAKRDAEMWAAAEMIPCNA